DFTIWPDSSKLALKAGLFVLSMMSVPMRSQSGASPGSSRIQLWRSAGAGIVLGAESQRKSAPAGGPRGGPPLGPGKEWLGGRAGWRGGEPGRGQEEVMASGQVERVVPENDVELHFFSRDGAVTSRPDADLVCAGHRGVGGEARAEDVRPEVELTGRGVAVFDLVVCPRGLPGGDRGGPPRGRVAGENAVDGWGGG